jgi:hypothetical protein
MMSVETRGRVIFTHTELIINGRPDTLWRVFVFVAAGGLCKKGAPNKNRSLPSSPSLPALSGSGSGSPGSCPFSDSVNSVLMADVGDRRVSQGDRMDDRNEDWRNVGGGEAGPAVVAASRAGITDHGQA